MPREFCLYLDENHCSNKRLLAVLEECGVRHERHSVHFRQGTPDAEWLPWIGQRGWSLLTTDKRIRYRKLERDAVRNSGIARFYFSTNNLSGREIAEALRKALPAMMRLSAQREPPFFTAVTRAGGVYLRPDL